MKINGLAGRRLTLALPSGGITLTYDRDVAGQVTAIRENGATSGVGVLATYSYDMKARWKSEYSSLVWFCSDH